ncbi:MAG: hypothetical protein ROR55_16465 [Devosia sp.]
MRILNRTLNDANGDDVASAHMVTTLAEAREDGEHVFVGDFYYALPDGVVMAKVIYERPNDTVDYTEGMTAIVVGGGGAYAGATATVEIGAGDHPAYDFSLICSPR